MAKWGKADFKELEKLQKKMQKLQEADTDKFCRDCSKELAARLLALVIPRTPVGDKPRIAAKDENDKKALGGVGAKKTVTAKGASGKSRSFLSREGAISERYWAGYMGGTLRRGWTAKTEEDAKTGGGKDAKEYAQSLPITKSGDVYQVEIVNPVSYASYVEYGHRQTPGRYVPALGKRLKNSWTKGKFMLTISEQELQAVAPHLLEKKLMQYIGGLFND